MRWLRQATQRVQPGHLLSCLLGWHEPAAAQQDIAAQAVSRARTPTALQGQEVTPQGWQPQHTATFARANARLREYMRRHADPCPYCQGSGIILEPVGFRGGRLFPVACSYCHGTGVHR
jgi:hypothetical protein